MGDDSSTSFNGICAVQARGFPTFQLLSTCFRNLRIIPKMIRGLQGSAKSALTDPEARLVTAFEAVVSPPWALPTPQSCLRQP